MIILVCGGRDYADWATLDEVLSQVHKTASIELLVHGAARGADSMAGQWARDNGIQEVLCPANWRTHGKSAGYKRNKAMLGLRPELVIAFPGGRGTEVMINLSERAGITVIKITGSVRDEQEKDS